MKQRSSANLALRRPVFLLVLALGFLAVIYTLGVMRRAGLNAPNLQATQAAAGTSDWASLLAVTPIAYTTPLPEAVATLLDGTYVKIDPSRPQAWQCRRCADYRPAGGIWKLQFDRGVMRILYDVTGWKSLASFTVSGDRLHLFNDPHCPESVGDYHWELADGVLKLDVVGDPCSIDLRGINLSGQAWEICRFGAETEGIGVSPSDPVGCQVVPTAPEEVAIPNLDLSVDVYGGDSRFYAKPPDITAAANGADNPPPHGINIRQSAESIPYGLNRILWWDGNWVEASTALPFNAIGVQFLGDPQIGWARVLFDGVEVWRGNTAAIWSDHGRHGGYVEITSFEPGAHEIRVESLGFDYRPVTVAGFGFSYKGGVDVGDR